MKRRNLSSGGLNDLGHQEELRKGSDVVLDDA